MYTVIVVELVYNLYFIKAFHNLLVPTCAVRMGRIRSADRDLSSSIQGREVRMYGRVFAYSEKRSSTLEFKLQLIIFTQHVQICLLYIFKCHWLWTSIFSGCRCKRVYVTSVSLAK